MLDKTKQVMARREFVGLFSLVGGGLALLPEVLLSTSSVTSRKTRMNIFAIGGQGLNWKDDNLLLAKYFLGLTGKENPKVCFIPTASGDIGRTIVNFYEAMTQLPCQPRHLRIFNPHVEAFEPYLLGMDAIYVGGGNTLNMIAIWREHGIDRVLREAWKRGIVLGGTSAGSICWFEQGSTDSRPGKLTAMDCLGFLRGSNCPHYDGEAARRPTYHQMIRSGEISPGIACDDGVGLHFEGEKLIHIVTARQKAKAYRVNLANGEVVEKVIHPDLLAD